MEATKKDIKSGGNPQTSANEDNKLWPVQNMRYLCLLLGIPVLRGLPSKNNFRKTSEDLLKLIDISEDIN